jgi:hypothetical protein
VSSAKVYVDADAVVSIPAKPGNADSVALIVYMLEDADSVDLIRYHWYVPGQALL